MTEEEGKIEEEKLEFTPEGETLGYISLDQARVLARRHAGDNREFYGRYANRELVWEELSAEESEDYYRVRLSYRPARWFWGEPGVELFVIDKAGPIELRQIVSEPRLVSTARAIVASAGALVTAGAVLGGLFAAGVFSSSPGDVVSVMVDPGSPLKVVSRDGNVAVDGDPGSVAVSSELLYRSLSAAEIPVLPPGYKVTDKAFDLTMGAPLVKPITITVRLSAADATDAGSVESNLVIQHYHDGQGRWEALLTNVDFGASTAQAQIDSLSMFALTIKKPDPTPTPGPPLRRFPRRQWLPHQLLHWFPLLCPS